MTAPVGAIGEIMRCKDDDRPADEPAETTQDHPSNPGDRTGLG